MKAIRLLSTLTFFVFSISASAHAAGSCIDFSGTWTAVCAGAHAGCHNEIIMKVAQRNCQNILIDDELFPIGTSRT